MEEEKIEILPFQWHFDEEEEHYSSLYNNLLKTGKTSLTVDGCRKYADMIPYVGDIEKDIEEILNIREDEKNAFMELSNGEKLPFDADEYLANAYPFELLFKYRY